MAQSFQTTSYARYTYNMSIPSLLIPPLRSALEASGFPANTVSDDGTINPAGLLAGVYDTVEFRSALTPSIKVNLAELSAQGGGPNPFVQFLRPTVILYGRGGTNVIAPAGPAPASGAYAGAVAVLALIGVGFVAGRLLK